MSGDKAIRAYGASACEDAAALVQTHTALVRRIALHMIARLPGHVQLEDLIQAGMIGLLEAANKFDANRGASFSTYAGIRIRGAMVDEIRRGDWVPRSVHRQSREIAIAINKLEARLGREPSDREIASELGMEPDRYYQALDDAAAGKLHSYETLLEDEQPHGRADELSRGLEDDRLKASVTDAISSLTEREQLVLSLYYEEGLNLKEVGSVLNVGESRVSQIMSRAIVRIRERLRADGGDG